MIAPVKKEGSKPRPFNFSIVVEARLDELLITTILAPVVARFCTIKQKLNQHSMQKHNQIDWRYLKNKKQKISKHIELLIFHFRLHDSYVKNMHCQIITDYVKNIVINTEAKSNLNIEQRVYTNYKMLKPRWNQPTRIATCQS